MNFVERFWNRIRGQHETAPDRTKGDAVAFAGGSSAGGVIQVAGAQRLLWLGSGINGYDSLLDSEYDYDSLVPSDNSIVAACLNWIVTNWATTKLLVGEMNGGKFEPLDGGHPLEKLIERPHPEYDGNWLVENWVYDLFDYGRYHGNIVTGGKSGPPTQIQYLPAQKVKPLGPDDPKAGFIGSFDYYPSGITPVNIKPEAMLYGRRGMDRCDPKYGRKPLWSARREIATDNAAAEVALAMMRKPHPGGVISPDGKVLEAVSPAQIEEDLRETRRQLEETTTGAHAGKYAAFTMPVKLQTITFSPKDLAIDEARDKPEQRVCALIGIPPQVVNLGTGEKSSTYNNVESAEKAAWHDCLIPLQDGMADLFTHRLLPMYPNSAGLVCQWDRSNVVVLQPDKMEERKQSLEEFKVNLITADEARADGGREALTPEQQAELTPEPDPAAMVPGENVPAATQQAQQGKARAKDASADTSGALYRVADRFRRDVGKREAKAVDALTVLLNAAEADLTRRYQALTDWIAAQEETGIPVSENTDRIRERWAELAAQVAAKLADLADGTASIVEDAQKGAAAVGAENARLMTGAALGTAPKGITAPVWNALPADTLEALAGFLADGSPLKSHLERTATQYLAEVQNALFAGIARSANPKEIARDMARYGEGPRNRYLATARTEVNRAAREAARRSYEANADVVTGYVRLSAADSRTCPACWGDHGREYATQDRFPSHVQCRCTLVPKTKSWAELTGDDSLPDTRPVIESGESLFKRLSEQEQEEVLGPGRYALYQAGTPLSDFVERSTDPMWGPQIQPATVANAQARASNL